MGLKIEILCSSPEHPVNPWLRRWVETRGSSDSVSLVHSKRELNSGDVLFLISCSEMIGRDIRDRFAHTAVVHASDLPEGRGWSPHIWAVLNGALEIVVSALVAEDMVDSGAIWGKTTVEIPKHALSGDINKRLFETTLKLMTRVCAMVENDEEPQPQDDRPPTYLPRRTPADSEIDPHASISSQFDALRVCDPDRFPAFFRLHGHAFEVRLKRRTTE
jgi:methionyl-tRNA formyltransferase